MVDVASTRNRLQADIDRVAARVGALEREYAAIVAASETANLDDEHDPEGATVGFERAQVGALLRQAREHVAELDAARQRLESGDYGTCRMCGKPIDEQRLAARPGADTCVDCATRISRR